jgi:hypothetical protein
MTKTEVPTSVGVTSLDPEIERLLYVGRMIGTLVNRAHTLLEPHEFSQSLNAIAALKETFDRELEIGLLQVYDRMSVGQTLS